jgi:hypothetical protein
MQVELNLGWHPSEIAGNPELPTSWVPVTPAGSLLFHLEAETEDAAWQNLLKDAAHMPYNGKDGFYERGYRVEKMFL